MSRLSGLGFAAALLLSLSAGPGLAAADPPPEELFDPDVVAEVDIGLPPASIETLEAEPKEEYQPATFTFKARGETYGPMIVGVRLKGSGSFRPIGGGKAALKVEIDEYDDQTFFGLEEITLNNMVQDPSMLHETLTYDVFRSVGVAASRTGYAFVRVNGEVYGVYAIVENVNDESLPRWFESTQHLYEGEDAGVDLKPGKAEDFKIQEGDEEDISDLESAIDAASEAGDFSEEVDGFINLEQMTKMWAVERYVGHWDGYSGEFVKNYFVHSDDAGVFTMMPWGTDQTWGKRLDFYGGTEAHLFTRCMADESCKALYDDALEEVLSTVGELELDRKAARLAELLAPCQQLEVEPRREHTAAGIATSVNSTLDFIATRDDELAAALGVGVPPEDDPGPSPSTEEPCTAQTPDASQPAATVTPPLLAPLRVSKPRARRFTVFNRARLPAAGLAEHLVLARMGGKVRRLCRGVKVRKRARALRMHCRVSRRGRARLRKRWMKAVVVTRFWPRAGKRQIKRRRLVIPRVAKGKQGASHRGRADRRQRR